MTKRLTALGFAAVAVVWGPYVYAELARKPLPPGSVEPSHPVIDPTPVAYHIPAPDRAQLLAALEAEQQKAADAPSPANVEPAAPERVAVEPAIGAASAAAPQPAAASAETTQAPATDPAVAPAAPAPPDQPAPQPGQPSADHPLAQAANSVAAQLPAAAVDPDAPTAAKPEVPAEEPSPSAAAKEQAEAANAEPKHPEAKHAEKKDGDEAANPESLAPAFRSAFDREARDTAWASGEEPRLAQMLAVAGVPASAIGEVRCQSTVCRVALNSVDLKATQQSPLYQLLYQRVRDEFGTLGLDPAGGDGEQHAAFYVLRKGYELEHARDTN